MDDSKLKPFIELKYKAIDDAHRELAILQVFRIPLLDSRDIFTGAGLRDEELVVAK